MNGAAFNCGKNQTDPVSDNHNGRAYNLFRFFKITQLSFQIADSIDHGETEYART